MDDQQYHFYIILINHEHVGRFTSTCWHFLGRPKAFDILLLCLLNTINKLHLHCDLQFHVLSIVMFCYDQLLSKAKILNLTVFFMSQNFVLYETTYCFLFLKLAQL